MKRNDIETQYKWNTDLIYSSKEAFDKDFEKAGKLIKEIAGREVLMCESARAFYDTLELLTETELIITKLYEYAHLNSDVDTADNAFLALSGKCENLFREMGAAAYYVSPKIIALDEKVLERWYEELPRLEAYRRNIEIERRYKPYMLDDSGEKLMAQMQMCLGSQENTRDVFSYADLKFEDTIDETGKRVPLNEANYVPFMFSHNREVRISAFTNLYKTYAQFANTYAALLNGYVKEKTTLAKIRKFASSLEASVFADEVPSSIYDNLIACVNQNMQVIYDYYALKKKALGVDELHMYDIYAPLVAEIDEKYTYEQAVEAVLDTVKVFGDEYKNTLEDGIKHKRWIDVFPTDNKKGGAYSAGCYGVQPYILLNFTQTLNDISTLAHEAGHSMHTYFSNKNNTPQQASYTIFVAEVASTVNELLLAHKLLRESNNNAQKRYILNELMETYKGTLYRQTMFAEFEKLMHAMSENGEILTADLLSEKYYEINKKYFGDAVVLDDAIRYEWMRIPHFYYNFYVYKYATCICAASAIVKRIETQGEAYVNKYIKFLSCGGSKSPLDSLKEAEIDMLSPDVVQAAIEDFSSVIKQFSELI
ncbi:MAG: oligoendopeptidase F [Clostridia bacterium]|nr:oligoendopeptidase F [Clostridia bacterium]